MQTVLYWGITPSNYGLVANRFNLHIMNNKLFTLHLDKLCKGITKDKYVVIKCHILNV